MQGTNSNIIPNVSCVFRQLVQISQKNSRLNTTQQTQSYMQKNIYSNNIPNRQQQKRQKYDFVSNMGLDDRQQRHQQLMNRFKNSLQENRQLLGLNNETHKNKYQHQTASQNVEQFKPYNNFNTQYNHHSYSNNAQHNQTRNQPKKWSIPQIKYRHIEDLQQRTSPKNSKLQSKISQQDFIVQSQTQSKLQKQFYGQSTIQPTQKQYPNKNIRKQSQQRSNQNYKTKTQEIDYDQNQVNQQLANKYSKYSNQPSKYNQNLQSYYELCRKPIKPSTITRKQSIKQSIKSNEQKFIRKPQSKVGGINLSKAIQILSFDD